MFLTSTSAILRYARRRFGVDAQHQRRAVGPLAPAVAVAVDEAVEVEQRAAPAPGRSRCISVFSVGS